MTLMLGTFALYSVLRMDWLNHWFNHAVRDIYGWNNLPQLASSLVFMLGSLYLVEHICNAAERMDLLSLARFAMAAMTGVVIASYALTEAPFLDTLPQTDSPGMLLHWLTLNFAACVSNGAMLYFVFQAMAEPGDDRAVLMTYQFAAGIGFLAATKMTLERITPIDFGVDGNQQLIYVCLIGYGCAAILNHSNKRKRPHPEREMIDGMG